MTDERIIAYLLKELPQVDRERFEDECFAQESWPAEMISSVEGDLIDAYLRDELTPERRQRFEQNYLTTEARQERVIMATALLRHIDECNAASKPEVTVTPTKLTWAERFRAFWTSQNWALRSATSIAVVAVIAGALWFSFLWFPYLRSPSPRTFATLTLTSSNINRAEGAQPTRVKLPPDVEALKVTLMLPQQSPPAASYRVELENDGGEKKSVEVDGKDAQSVVVVIPAAQLAREPYALKLFAIKADGSEQRINGSYFFLVE